MKAYFITGTDTGVGKTSIMVGLAGSMRKLGMDVGIMKPIATGYPKRTGFRSSDVTKLVEATSIKDPENLINPVFLPLPTSPYDATKLLELSVDMPLIFDQFKKLLSIHEILLVEGIGGIMTPITKNFFVADMIKGMGIETIIVTRATIGTLNHTVMTCKMCKDYGIKIRGLIINNFDEKGTPAEKNSSSTLYEITNIPILGTVPFIKDLNNAEKLIEYVEKYVNVKSLIS
ncbi:MAG TPA: dethiobiotin synthase [Nitrosopumilaceae archaeon]|nr:dethiobiotin synthase [Nitrosopumilaceae archaeon]